MRIAALICVILIFLGLLPVFSVLIAGLTANAAGCNLDEGSVYPCVIFGADIGSLLYTMGVFGWLGLITLPIAALGALGLIITGTLAAILRLRRR
jgi:hypothetical protein